MQESEQEAQQHAYYLCHVVNVHQIIVIYIKRYYIFIIYSRHIIIFLIIAIIKHTLLSSLKYIYFFGRTQVLCYGVEGWLVLSFVLLLLLLLEGMSCNLKRSHNACIGAIWRANNVTIYPFCKREKKKRRKEEKKKRRKEKKENDQHVSVTTS